MDRERLRRLHVQANHRVDWNVRDRSRSKEENSFWFEVIRFIMLVVLNLGDFFRPWRRLANKQERLFEVIRFTMVVIFQIRETFSLDHGMTVTEGWRSGRLRSVKMFWCSFLSNVFS